jgi:hypothetical protein
MLHFLTCRFLYKYPMNNWLRVYNSNSWKSRLFCMCVGGGVISLKFPHHSSSSKAVRRSYRDKVQSRNWRNNHLETAPLGDPSHKQPPNPDTRQMPTGPANRSLIYLSPEGLCQCPANTEVDPHSHPLYWVPGPQWRSQRKYPGSLRTLKPHRGNINMN